MYLSLGKLIKLCDEVLLSENEENCASLSNENVTEVVDLVDAAIIVSKCRERRKKKLTAKKCNHIEVEILNIAHTNR